jgi:hypothetical protein
MTTEKRGRPRKEHSPREDWLAFGPTTDDEGNEGIGWNNTRSGELVVLPQGVHPLEAKTALALAKPVAAEQAADEIEDEESAVDRIRTLLRGSKDSKASVKLYRVRDDGKIGFCRSYTPEEFELGSLDLIARQWGPGNYEIRVYGQNASGKTGVLARDTIIVEAASESLPGPALEQSTLGRILERLEQRIATVETAKPDPVADFQRTLAMLATVKDLFAPAVPVSPASMVKELAETLGVLKMVREEIEPSPVPDDPLAASLPRVLDLIAGAQKAAPVAEAFPSVQVPQLPASPPMAQNPPETDEADMMKLAFAWLIGEAKKDAPVDAPADTIYERAPDELLALLKTANWFEQLTTVHPAIAPYRAWFTRLRDEILRIEREESQPEPPAKAA